MRQAASISAKYDKSGRMLEQRKSGTMNWVLEEKAPSKSRQRAMDFFHGDHCNPGKTARQARELQKEG